MTKYHSSEREVWDLKKCQKAARAIWRDSLGTPGPRGIVQIDSTSYPRYGAKGYNGGCVIDGEWYQGINNPWPLLPEPYVFAGLPSWGTVIVTRVEAQQRKLHVKELDPDGFPWGRNPKDEEDWA